MYHMKNTSQEKMSELNKVYFGHQMSRIIP